MKTKRPYSKHGATVLMRRLSVSGMESVDRRYGAARAMGAERAAHEASLGGVEHMSAMAHSILDVLVVTKLAWSKFAVHVYRHRARLVGVRHPISDHALEQFTRLGAAVVKYEQALVSLEAEKAPALDEGQVIESVRRELRGKKRPRRARRAKPAPASSATHEQNVSSMKPGNTSSAAAGVGATMAAEPPADTSASAIASARPAGVAAQGDGA